MEKTIKLEGSQATNGKVRDQKIREKLETLSSLCMEYSQYLENWNRVEVEYDRFTGEIEVTWYNEVERQWPTGDVTIHRPFTRRIFGVEDLDQRILSYRNKIKYAQNKANES